MSRLPLRLLPLEERTVPTTFFVNSTADLDPAGFNPVDGSLAGGVVTLRSAVLAANTTGQADTVMVPAGTYTLTRGGANEDLGQTGDLDVTSDLTLDLTSGAVVDAAGLGDRVLDVPFLAAGSAAVVVHGGTLRNGAVAAGPLTAAQGGGVRGFGPLTLTDVTVTGNQVTGGVGQANLDAGDGLGGGVYAGGDLTITGGSISNNTAVGGDGFARYPAGAGRGGGLYATGSATAELTGVRVTGNTATGGQNSGTNEGTIDGDAFGGGVDAERTTITATDVRIDGNQAVGGPSTGGDGNGPADGGDAYGGGFAAFDAAVTLARSTVDANTARGGAGPATTGTGGRAGNAFGGGLAVDGDNGFTFTLTNLTVSGNTAQGADATGAGGPAVRGEAYGGGLYVNGNSTTAGFIAFATLTDNEAAIGAGTNAGGTAGGGLYRDANVATIEVGSTVVAGNRAPAGPDVDYDPDGGGPPFVSTGANIIGASDGTAGFDGTTGDQVGTLLAPLDALLTPLGYFGGSPRNRVHALNPGSPARDLDPKMAVATDERGFTRPVNGQSDAGAFEVQIPAIVTQAVGSPLVTGQPFTVTATVTDPRFQPTGTVRLFVNGVAGGTGTLDAAGTFTFTATAPAAGTATVSIAYDGDAAYLPANSAATTAPVLVPSATTVTTAPNPSLVNETITFTATVTAADGSTPTGTVTFILGGADYAPVPVDATGTATFALTSGPGPGTYPVTAIYNGSATVQGSTGAGSQTVLVPTALGVSATPNPAFVNQPVTLTATLFGTDIYGVPTGTVTFRVDGTPVGTVVLPAVRVATLTLPGGLPQGSYAVTADYSPTGFFQPASAPPATLAVNPAPTATTTAVSPNPAFTNQSLTLSAAVTAAFGSPTGNVTFNLNGTPVGTATVDAAGNATLPLPAGLAAGTYTLTADSGATAATLASSSQPVTLTVVPSPTTTALAVAPNSPAVGTPLTLTAAVTATFGTPTGTVNFLVNGTSVGTAAVDDTGRAVLPLPAGLAAGSYTLRADYAGVTGVFDASMSPPQSITLTRTTTATAVTASPNPVLATDPFTLTATVTSAAGTPTGTVAFFLDGAAVGSATLDAAGVAVLSLPAGVRVGDGSYAIDATYNGDATFSSSFAPTGTLTVNPVPTRTTLVATPPTAPQGTAVTLTASVAFAVNTSPQRRTAAVSPAILNGTVNFFAGTTLLGSAPVANGTATLTVTSLPVGTNDVSAVFVPATADLTGSRGTAAVTVTPLPPPAVREIFAVGTGYGDITVVKVYDADGNEITTFRPFGDNYWCGAVVSTADVTGDGTEDVIVTAPLGAGPRVKVYDGTTFAVVADFFAYEPTFVGGASLAAGDLTGDGVAEFVTGAGPGGGPLVKVYSFVNGTVQLLNSFFAYADTLRSGVTVAVSGGLLATGPGYTGGPQVNVYAGAAARPVASFFAFDPASRDGVNVSLGFDGTRTVLTAGRGAGGLPEVATFDATTGARLGGRTVYESSFQGGVTVTTVRSAAGEVRTVVGTGIGGGPRVRILGPNDTVVKDFFAVNDDFRGGVFVG